MKKKITNPVLRGFNPDPSILRVGKDYYIATSTFAWFPGVSIYHSRDLINWRLLTRPLQKVSQLNMYGCPDSGGVYAPNLTYSGGRFYLLYTNVKSFGKSIFSDSHNYLVSANEIDGEWSDPIALHSYGYDPSLFHDESGKKWVLCALTDHRPWKNYFSGIVMQEYSEEEQRMVGQVYKLTKGTELGITEGPNLYQKDGYFYLILAEGGTFRGHAVTLMRSRNITGPYEECPYNPILTSRDDSTLKLQRSGHGSLVQTQSGEWYIAHLCGRPLPASGRCIMGRETAIQRVRWTEDYWLRLEDDSNRPSMTIDGPDISEHVWDKEPLRDDFNSTKLNIHFQTLRMPLNKDMYSLKERPGYLRLKGKESLSSLFNQSLIARRQEDFCYRAETCIEFVPESFKQMAGLICYYDTFNFYYLHITHDEQMGRCLNILVSDNGTNSYLLDKPIPINSTKQCALRVEVKYEQLQFFYSITHGEWAEIGTTYDASTMSDEYYELIDEMRFTGAFVGFCCQDLTGTSIHADFDYFDYQHLS